MKSCCPLSIRLYVLVLLPLSGLAFFGMRTAYERWTAYRSIVALQANSAVLQQFGAAVHELQKERGRSAGYLTSRGREFSEELKVQRAATDATLRGLREKLVGFDASRFGSGFAKAYADCLRSLERVSQRRPAIDSLLLPAGESTAFYTGVIDNLLYVISEMSHLSDEAEIANGIYSYVTFMKAKEQAGLERATLSGVFAADAFTDESLRRYGRTVAMQDAFLSVFAQFATPAQQEYEESVLSGEAVDAVAAMREAADAKSDTGGFGVSADAWFDASTKRIDLMKNVEDRLAADYSRRADELRLEARREFVAFASVTVVVLLITGVGAWLLVRVITGRLFDVAARLGESSRQVAAAANQVSSASVSCASGSTRQAASLQETTASLEEISSMTRRNAEAAATATRLSHDTCQLAESGSSEMDNLTRAMDDIKAASTNIAQVVRSIDEIAFQTNILALNAAVEAARAGEAGAGFAVVAEEVRALAQRSASAAKETAEMINASVKSSERGVAVSSSVAHHLSEILDQNRKIDPLVGQVAQASREQSEEIGRLNRAMAEIDAVTQSGAAAAEETASQAEELSAQSVELSATIDVLLTLVRGGSMVGGNGVTPEEVRGHPDETAPTRSAPAGVF